MRYVLWAVAGAILGTLLMQTLAHGASPPRKLERCMVYLPAMKDAKLRRWCLKQSERMP